jgi:hypothetical protein
MTSRSFSSKRLLIQAAIVAAIIVLLLAVFAGRALGQPPDVLRDYRFIPQDTVVHVSGGPQGYNMDLTIAGTFGLVTGYNYVVDPTAHAPTLDPFAQFINVHGILYNPLSLAPLPVPGWDLDKTLNLSGLKGTFSVSSPNQLFFLGADGAGVALRLEADIEGKLLHITGGSSDPPGGNPVLYRIDALAHLTPFPDFNFDGSITVADVSSMLAEMSSPQTYMAAHNLSSTDVVSMGDLDGDGKVTNSDLQGLIVMLANGGGSASLSAVPEPPAVGLLAAGGLLLIAARARSVHCRFA